MSRKNRQSGIRHFLPRLVFSLAVFILMLGSLEGALRVLPSTRNRGVNFTRTSDGQWSYIGNDSGIKFASPKPAGTFRVFCLGGSATMGSIYNPRSTFSHHLREMLGSASKGDRVEVINLGQTLLSSDGLLEILLDSLRFEPDLVIVYSGNNEMVNYSGLNPVVTPILFALDSFLRRHARIGRLIPKMRYNMTAGTVGRFEFTEERQFGIMRTLYPESLRQVIVEVYLHNLEAMARACGNSHVPIMFSTVAVNYRGWSPQRSRYPESMPLEARLGLQEKIHRAEQAWREGRIEETASLVQEVLAQAPEHARAWFLKGQIELAQGRDDEARQALLQALNFDDFLISRTPSYQNGALLEHAGAWPATVVDTAAAFDRLSPHRITGEELIDDYCHPTLDGQLLIAATLAEEVARRFPDRFDALTTYNLLSRKDEWLRRLDLTPGYLALRIQEMAFYLAFAYEDLFINEHAVHLFQRIEGLNPDSSLPHLGVGLIRLRQGEDEAGRLEFEKALAKGPDHVTKMAGLYFWRFLNFRDPYLFVKSAPGISFSPLLHDYVTVSSGNSVEPPAALGLDQAGRVYRWDRETGQLIDLSRQINERLRMRKEMAADSSPRLTLFQEGKSSTVIRPVGMNRIRDGVFESTSSDPYLLFPSLAINPLQIGRISIAGQVRTETPQPLCVYWRDRDHQDFSEEFKACADAGSGKAKGGQSYLLDLADDPDWLLSSTITELRLDPAEGKASLYLLFIDLLP